MVNHSLYSIENVLKTVYMKFQYIELNGSFFIEQNISSARETDSRPAIAFRLG